MLVESPMDLGQKTPRKHKDKKKCWQKAQWTQDKRPPKDTKTKESVVKRPKDLRQKTPTKQKQMRLLTEGLMDLRQKTENPKKHKNKRNYNKRHLGLKIVHIKTLRIMEKRHKNT